MVDNKSRVSLFITPDSYFFQRTGNLVHVFVLPQLHRVNVRKLNKNKTPLLPTRPFLTIQENTLPFYPTFPIQLLKRHYLKFRVRV